MKQDNAMTLRWAVGSLCALAGTAMLVAPNQFGSVAYAALRPHVGVWGAGFLLAGVLLLSVTVLGLPRPFHIAAHVLAGAGLILLANGFALVGGWVGVIHFLVLGPATLGAFFERRHLARLLPTPPDLLPIILAISTLVSGATMLAMPGLYDSPANAAFRPYIVPLGLAFVLGGLAVLIAYRRADTPRAIWVLSHLMLGGALVLFCLVASFPTRAWIGIAYYGGFGLIVAALPWSPAGIRRTGPSSLQGRIVLVLALASSLPLIVAIAVVSDRQEQYVAGQTLALQGSLASTTARAIEDYLEVTRTAVVQVASQPGFMQKSAAEQRQELRSLTTTYPDALSFATFDSAGNPIARSDDAPLVAARGYPVFEVAKASRKTSTDVLISPVFHRLVVSFGAPAWNSDGSFAGVVVVATEPKKLAAILNRADPGPGTIVTLVDSNGRALGMSEAPPVESIVDVSDEVPVARTLSSAPGSQGAFVYSGQSGEHFVGYSRLDGLGWGVIVDTAETTAMAGVHAQRDSAFLILILCMAVALVAGAVGADLLAHPLSALARAAKGFSEGDASLPLPSSGVSQIADLTSSFDDMRQRLAARTRERESLLTEIQIRASELDSVISSMVAGVIIYDAGGRMRLLNPAGERMLRYTDEDRALPLAERVTIMRMETADGRPLRPEETPTGRALRGETVDGFTMLVHLRDGSTFWTMVSSAPILSPDGQIAGVVTTFADVTAEMQLRSERERLLASEQEARAEAEAAVRVRDEFMSIAAHELKTPVTSLRGFAQLTRRQLAKNGSLDPDRLSEAMERIDQQSKRLTKLTEQLLDLSRLQSGKLSVSREETDLRSLVSRVVTEVLSSNTDRTIAVTGDLGRPVHADPLRIEQVLVNLLSNAIKFSPEGSQIDLELDTVETRWARIVVRDRGIGIPEEKREHIFERFYQAHTEGHHGGMGIGLYVSREIVEMHGGSIIVEAPDDGGSRFVVRLPLSPGGDSLAGETTRAL